MNRLHTKKKQLQKTNNQCSKTPWGKYKQGQVVDWGEGSTIFKSKLVYKFIN